MSDFETAADDVQQLPEPGAPEATAEQEPAGVVRADLEAFEVPEPPATGDQAVDEALNGLAAALADPAPADPAHPLEGQLDGHVAAFERAHRALQDRLADVEG